MRAWSFAWDVDKYGHTLTLNDVLLVRVLVTPSCEVSYTITCLQELESPAAAQLVGDEYQLM